MKIRLDFVDVLMPAGWPSYVKINTCQKPNAVFEDCKLNATWIFFYFIQFGERSVFPAVCRVRRESLQLFTMNHLTHGEIKILSLYLMSVAVSSV